MTHQPLPDGRRHLLATLGLFVALFALLGWRLHDLQVDRRDMLVKRAAAQRERTWVLPAQRGSIHDINDAPLVRSEGTWTIRADPDWMTDKLRATVELSRLLGLPRDQLRAQFESTQNGRLIAKGIPEPEPDAVDIPDEIRRLKLTGIQMRREFSRIYQEQALAPHILGFVQADGNGGMGIELVCDQLLTGADGSEQVTIDAQGKPVLDSSRRVPPRNGASVQLTIDLAIQRKLQDLLAEAADKHAPTSACGIVLRPTTGEVVAMASWPDFDPADRRVLTPQAMRNNVLNFVYEPGSTMKPLVTGAAVADGLFRWTDRIDCERGAWTFSTGKARRTIHESTGGHGILSLVECIALSDNIAMAKIGTRMGPDRLKQWIEAFGFGKTVGISLPGEDAGILPVGRAWNLLDACMSVPMGHAIAVTPLQMAMAHSAIANGGQWLPPRLIRRIWGEDGRDLEPPALPAARRVFSAADALQIQQAMTHTMTDGTGKRVQLEGYSAAGKTGTAEKLIGGQYSKNRNDCSFVCWAPAEPGVRPELLCLVVIEAPTKNGRFGADTAAPVVRDVLQYGLEYLKVPKHESADREDAR
jgi:cell division protein FtsI/penicillin-binding protein 2